MISLNLTPDSSQLHGYGYDAENEVLAVEYRSNHDQVTYHYRDVPASTAEGLEAAESKGSFIFKHVKPKYEVDRIEKHQDHDRASAAQPQEDQARA